MKSKDVNPVSRNYAGQPAINGFLAYFEENGLECFRYDCVGENLKGLYEFPQKVGYEMLKSFCNKIGRPDLVEHCVIEFVSQNRFQAYAAKHQGKYFIGISAALPALLQALFQNLFTFTNPLTDPYDRGTEEDEEDDTTYVFPNRLMYESLSLDALQSEIVSLVSDTIPKERWQRIMSIKFAELGICFCIAHEIGHLVQGHMEITGLRAVSAIEEAPGAAKKRVARDVGRWLSQSMEIEADRIGMALLYSYAIGTKANRKKFMRDLRCHKDDAALYGRVLYAVYFVFLLLGQQQHIIDVKGSHPNPITRVSYLMAFLGTVMTQVEDCDSKYAGDIIEKYADIAEAAWGRIGFSSGRHVDTIDDLPAVITQLERAKGLVEKLFGQYQWVLKYGQKGGKIGG